MPKVLRVIVIVGGAVLAFVVLGMVAVWFMGGRALERAYALPAESLALPTDSAALVEGERQATLLGCSDCHGANLAGSMFIDAMPFVSLPAPNLTTGEGGVGAAYSAADFEHAIRHGIDRNGQALMIMPSYEYNHFADDDIGRLIAFLQAAPPVNNALPPRTVGLIGRMIAGVATGGLLPAARIDQTEPHPVTVQRATTAEYGAYLARPCAGCHGPDFAGARVPGTGPEVPPASNLTSDAATGLGTWSETDFATALREGIRPDGSYLNAAMPSRAYALFTDEEVQAVWLFLRTLEPVEARGY
jgi:mono/diheme cytochrome c family protein